MKRRLQHLWQRLRRPLGLPGAAALLLLALASAAALTLPRLNRQSDELRAAVAATSQALARQTQPAPRIKRSGEQALEFAASFPPLSQSSIDLGKVFDAARHQNIALPKGDYQLKPEPGAPLQSYSVTFAVNHEYRALKAFVAEVLEALPHASLDELRMARTDTGSGVLEVAVRFTFVYRSP